MRVAITSSNQTKIYITLDISFGMGEASNRATHLLNAERLLGYIWHTRLPISINMIKSYRLVNKQSYIVLVIKFQILFISCIYNSIYIPKFSLGSGTHLKIPTKCTTFSIYLCGHFDSNYTNSIPIYLLKFYQPLDRPCWYPKQIPLTREKCSKL